MWRFLMYAIGRPYAILWHQKLELYGYTLCVAKGCGQVSLLLCPESSLPFASCEPAWATVTAQHRRPLRATSNTVLHAPLPECSCKAVTEHSCRGAIKSMHLSPPRHTDLVRI